MVTGIPIPDFILAQICFITVFGITGNIRLITVGPIVITGALAALLSGSGLRLIPEKLLFLLRIPDIHHFSAKAHKMVKSAK